MLEKLPDAVGHALADVRAGLDKTLFSTCGLRQGLNAITLTSLAFADHAPIPERYTADGVGDSPPLAWRGVPEGAGEVVLIVEDADSPTPLPLVHAIVVALPGADGALAEGALGRDIDHPPVVPMGRNSLLRTHWLPPDPPPGHGLHRYVFQVFALAPVRAADVADAASAPGEDGRAGDADDDEGLGPAPGRDELRRAIERRGLAAGCLVGTHERPDTTITEPTPGAAVA